MISTSPITLAFDVYGTLIDPQAITPFLERYLGANASEFSAMWRGKQLEYSFRRGLMKKYVNFEACTRQALDYTCDFYPLAITTEEKNSLLGEYLRLPLFSDVFDGLRRAKNAGFRLYAFSNGEERIVDQLLALNGIRDFFEGVVSVDELKTFKPDPEVYRYFLDKTGSSIDKSWLISSNSFDLLGAVSAGMKAAWICRTPEAILDPWEITPQLKIKTLTELTEKIK